MLQSIDSPLRTDATGTIRIGDTRVTLETVVRKFLAGDTPETIAEAYALSLSQVYSTVSYFLQHQHEVHVYLNDTEDAERKAVEVIEQRTDTNRLREKLRAHTSDRLRMR